MVEGIPDSRERGNKLETLVRALPANILQMGDSIGQRGRVSRDGQAVRGRGSKRLRRRAPEPHERRPRERHRHRTLHGRHQLPGLPGGALQQDSLPPSDLHDRQLQRPEQRPELRARGPARPGPEPGVRQGQDRGAARQGR